MHSGMSHLYSRTSPRNQESDSDLLLHGNESHTTEPHYTRTSLRTPSPFPTSITTHARKKSNKDKKLKKSTPTHRENGKWEYGNTGAESHKFPQPTAHRLLQSPDYKNSKGSSTWTPGHRRVNPSLLRLRSESHLSADERTPTHNPPTPPAPPAPPAPNTQHSAHVYETRLGNDKKSLGFCKQKSLAEDKLLQPTQQAATQQTTTNYKLLLLLLLQQASTSTSTTICCKAVKL